MYRFFAGIGSTSFHLFNHLHIFLIASLVICGIALFLFRNSLKKFKYKENIRIIMATILLLNMIIYYLGLFVTRIFNVLEDLPLHICFVTNFFMIYVLYKGDRNLYQYVYFFTFIGPIPAIIWSDLRFTYDTYEFWQFIICHHVMLLTSLYLLFVLEYKVEAKYMLKAFLIGVLYVILVNIGNAIFHTNYIMLTALPDNILKLYPFLSYFPPILPLFVVGILAFLFSYLPAYMINKLNTREISMGK